ncbi:MAG: hypothetical protein J6X43_04985 [Bacteroidales bacterium]|nr:hypothetical protein [Bacteroidales bacterium]
MAKRKLKDLQQKAEELKAKLGVGTIWLVEDNGQWFTQKPAADFIASVLGCKVIEY